MPSTAQRAAIDPVLPLAQRPVPGLLARSRSALGAWEAEDLAELRRRVALFGLITLAVVATMNAVYLTQIALGLLDEQVDPGGLVELAVLGALVLAMRRTPDARRVLRLDALVMLALGLNWAYNLWREPLHKPMELPVMFASTAVLFIRSFVVPSWFRRSLWVGALALVPGTAMMVWRGGAYMARIEPDMATAGIVFSIAWTVVCLVLSALASHSLFGLRQQVRAASRLGRYTIERKLGEGGMGEVYLAHHVAMRRPAAIKVLRPDRVSLTAVAAFEAEVAAMSQLTHPNTVPILDYGRTCDGVFYYAMEYLDGLDLERLVREQGPQPEARVIHLLRQAAGALAEAHAKGLLHRDIKPANLIVSERGGVPDVLHVLDFGLAARLGHLAAGHGLVGTPGYVAPEAIERPAEVDARSDLYSLGAVGYWLLTGTQVFEAGSPVEVCLRHVAGEVESPSLRARRIFTAGLEELIVGCLAKRREDRPASARELERALAALAEGPCCVAPAAAPLRAAG